MKLRTITPWLIALSVISTNLPAQGEEGSISSSTPDVVKRVDASEPVVYDLGDSRAVIFYYTDENGDRLLVTTIGPKDPDADLPATQQIVKMNDQDSEYVVNIESAESGTNPLQLSAHFDGNDLIVAFDKV